MTISIRLSKEETEIIKSYSLAHGFTMSELFRTAVFEKIEKESDLKFFQKAYENYETDSKTYSFEEASKLLSI